MENMNQGELEKPAKNYQVKAVVDELKNLNDKFDIIVRQTSNIVTPDQLKQVEEHAKQYTDNEVETVHLTYGPLKRNVSKFIWIIITAVIGQLITLAGLALLAFSKL